MCCRESLLSVVEAPTGAESGTPVVLGELGDWYVEILDKFEDEAVSLEITD
jgi:hypothetical protein